MGYLRYFGSKSRLCLVTSISLFLLVDSASCFARNRGLPPQQGVLNFGQVAEGIFRGAEPDTAAVTNLQRFGIKTIIDLRKAGQVRKEEAIEAVAAGMFYTNVPLPGLSRPTDDQVKSALVLIDTLPKPIFIHCQHGCDRTGTVVACYRIKHDHWSGKNALQEAFHYGMSWFERGMRSYVAEFGRPAPVLAEK